MKRLLVTVMALVVVLVLATAPVAANGPLAMADLSAGDPTAVGQCLDFHVGAPGNWGGRPGERAVAAFPGEDPAGDCSLQWTGGKARRIELEVLDGLADDSFEVYVKNPAGKWVLVYSYTDQYSSETWVTHHIYSFPAGKGQGTMVDLMIVPINVGWSGFNTYGQLAVDYIALYSH